MKRYGLLGLGLAAALLAGGCHQVLDREGPRADPVPPPPTRCDAEDARWALGQHATDQVVERAHLASGARNVRVMRPDEAHTMEFNSDRLSIEVDDADRIVGLRCA